MSEYSRGGMVSGPATTVTLDDDECVLNRDLHCIRTDAAHYRERIEIRTLCEEQGRVIWGQCHHRHPVPVDSTVDGEILAYLCTHCDTQLPA